MAYGTIYTIGHSKLPSEEFVEMLDWHNITLLVDVRSHPGSRKNPQYGMVELRGTLGDDRYLWMPDLGGPMDGEYADPTLFPKHHICKVRPEYEHIPEKDRPKVWYNVGLYDYATWMGSSGEFIRGLTDLFTLSTKHRIAIMCAEARWWKCHRSMIADAIESVGGEAWHIMTKTNSKRHPQGDALQDRLVRYEPTTSWIWNESNLSR